MADLPVYSPSSSDIKLQKPTTGFQSALAEHNAGSVIGAVGTSIATDAAIQNAKESGQAAAVRGDKLTVPAITKADAQFVGAYKEQAYGQAYTSISRTLNNLQRMASADPNDPNLEAYKSSSLEVINSVLSDLPKDVRKNLELSITPLLDSQYYSLALNAEAAGTQSLQESRDEYFAQRTQDATNFAMQGNYEASDAAFSQLKEQAPHLSDEADRLHAQARTIGQLKEALDSGDTHRVTTILSESGQDPAVSAYAWQYQAAKRSRQTLDYLQAQGALEAGQPISSVLSSFQLTAENKQRLINADIQNKKQQTRAAQTTANFLAAAQSGDALATSNAFFTDSQVDDAFGSLIEASGNNSLQFQAQVAAQIPRAVPVFQKQLTASLKYGSPEQIQAAAASVQLLSNTNAIALDGMSKEDLATAFTYNNITQDAAKLPEDAAKEARLNASGLTLQQKLQAQDEFKANLKGKKVYTEPKQIRGFLAGELGHRYLSSNVSIMPSDLVGAFENLLTKNSQYTTDPDVAAKMAVTELKRSYSESKINGRAEIMRYAPDTILPNTGNFQQNSKKLSIKEVATRNAEAKQKGLFTFMDIEYPDAPDYKTAAELIDSKPGAPAPKIKINGKSVEVIVGSDDRNAVGKVPSWPLFYVNDQGIQLPILDVDGSQARWTPDLEPLQQYHQEKLNKQVEEARKIREYQQKYPEASYLPLGIR